MSSGVSIHDLARRRRQLIQIELDFFKSRTNTIIEILSYLVENDFSAPLSDIYENTQATEVSVRQHLRALEKLNLINRLDGENDRRAKVVTMTDHGRKHLLSYAEHLNDLLKDK
ncbi:MAG: ArsR family transcriptional regulator [Alphaproteobacteria bacterium]|jgi:DNA-binding MarR family transcriptional regulator|nr:ArsR family transcriptional regulator [Alphaproteobacteria bacterium]